MSWFEIKLMVIEWTRLDRDALHIYFSVMLQIVACAVLRRPLSSVLPLGVVIAAGIFNEWLDFGNPMPEGPTTQEIRVEEAIKDLANGVIIPAVLMLVARSPFAATIYGTTEVASTGTPLDPPPAD